ncbi:MAG TPA: cytochrome c oxidase accessory protein CcoG [Pseudomonadales bacterium]
MSDDLIASTNKKSLYKKRDKIYTRVIAGRSQLIRVAVATLVYGAFFLLPWINIGDRPAVHFDLAARQFHILWLTFWPQDFVYLAWLLIIAAFALFFFTTVAGRLWCGFACPQTIWTLAFMWVEQKIEGSPNHRRQLDKSPWSAGKIGKKAGKHAIWLVMALLTGATFVSYFYPARELWSDALAWQLPLVAGFWVGVFTWLTYVDAAWLREQVCIYMCPYARFQSVMYDQDTLLVSYDADKGEPRGSLKEAGHGQCIDCYMCVQVCPTGIDIRDGVQISCINCALCVDACDEVMQSIGKPSDLIRFTTLNALENKQPTHLLRPRSIGYALVLLIMLGLLASQLWQRTSLETSIVRDRDHIYRQLANGDAANDYWVKLANKSQQVQQYRIRLEKDGYRLHPDEVITVQPGETLEHNLMISTGKQQQGSQNLTLDILSETDGSLQGQLETRFVHPPAR